jgi:hypothetical protein
LSGLEILLGSAFAVVYGSGLFVAAWMRHASSGWSSIAAAGFDTSKFPRDGDAGDAPWLRARIGMKHFEARGALRYFPLRGQANGAGLVLKPLQLGAPRGLSIPWDQVAVVDPDDPHHRGGDLCLHVGGRASVLLSMDGPLADAIRAALATRVQTPPPSPPYR